MPQDELPPKLSGMSFRSPGGFWYIFEEEKPKGKANLTIFKFCIEENLVIFLFLKLSFSILLVWIIVIIVIFVLVIN